MGSYKARGRRPFIWQDEMAEVKNLFRKVAKVKSSGFTGFSVWKDEPTAETLSKNRLQRRRNQFALDLTHLNYSESPYQALSHLHNIRGMCSRIQRQDLFVERKKKDYDAEIHPSLLRRPITASTSTRNSWDGGDRSSFRSRPGSAPVRMGTPLHYSAPKPTVLYDATHKCPRFKSFPKRPSSSSTTRSGRSVKEADRGTTWDSSALSSPPHTSSIPSSTWSPSIAQSGSTTFRMNTEFALRDGFIRKDVDSSAQTTDAEVSNSEVYSSEVETGPQGLSSSVSMDQRPSSRLRSPAIVQERPPSRLVSKRPQLQQQVDHESRKPDRRNEMSSLDSVGHKEGYGKNHNEGVPMTYSTSTSAGEVLISNGRASSSREKEKPQDRECGLWALKQQQRPMSGNQVTTGRGEPPKPRPSTSPSNGLGKADANSNEFFPPSSHGHGKVRFGCSTPTTNKNTGKREEIVAAQRCFDQELQQVLHSDDTCYETDCSVRTEQDNMKANSDHASSSGRTSCEQQSTASEALNSAAAAESHVLIKHSTDPYADFKKSMMHMINEEGLIDKQWELEELFQYYMDLNPAIHHDILRRVINDIRIDLAAEKAKQTR